MTQQLWQSAKLATMGELSASVAHELNNPLATISLRVESLLAQVAPDDPKHRPLEIIQDENERMGGLVRRLLESSRRSVQQISTLDVRQEVDSTLELALHYLRNRNVSVQREFTETVPLIHADRQHLRQLFLNLFTNASDAMPNGGTLTIRIASLESEGEESSAPVGAAPSTAPAESPSRRVVVEVSDTGVGIPAALLARVAEPFFTTKPEGQGTGLGLAICRRIAEEHGGHLDISSAVGTGTTVRVAFPAGPA
jgi:signal transduction histidine kinase